jgi:micrococcal nuclease
MTSTPPANPRTFGTLADEALIVIEEPPMETLGVTVVKVFDGDGFLASVYHPRKDINFEVAIRCGFIDAPEMGQPGGQQAKAFFNSLIGGKKVDLVVLTKMDTGGSFDRHGRIVCVPYLTEEPIAEETEPEISVRYFLSKFQQRPKITRNIELEMVVNGWAWVLERYGPDERYMDALSDARHHRRGIWALDDNEHPWDFKKKLYQQRRPKKQVVEHTLFSADVAKTLCPQDGCGGHLAAKNGKYGAFLGCTNFPRCKYTRNQ